MSASIRAAVVAALKADPAVVAALGDRVFPGVVPDTQRLPALVYEFSRVRRQHDLDGPTGLVFASVRLHAVARYLSDCDTIAEAVRQLLDGRTARLAFPGGAVDVLETLAADESDSWTQSVDGSGVGVFEIEMAYSFLYREPLPARMT